MNILVCLEHKNGSLAPSSWQSLSVAMSHGQQVCALVFGPDLDPKLLSLGLKKIYRAPKLHSYHPLAWTKALLNALELAKPDLLLGQGSTLGKDLFPRVAAETNGGLLTDVVELLTQDGKITGGIKPLYAGKILSHMMFKESASLKLMVLRQNAFPQTVAQKESPAPEEITLDHTLEQHPKIQIKEIKTQQTGKIELTEARRIISGGRSLGSEANFDIIYQCAKVLNAAVGASRAAVDSGYAKHDMQVGQTGKTVSPDLYIACGISGAIQHMAGMRTSKTIVAINTDPQAPIFSVADYGIVGDLFQIVPLLKEKLAQVL